MKTPSQAADRGPGTMQETTTVASVPSSHVYVRHVAAERPDGVVRLPDPDPESPDRSTQQRWWPPVMLDPAWVREHEFDVFHVQFGFDAWEPADLETILREVHATGRSVVYTAHDLRNPHHGTRELHDAQLTVLMRHADAVVTLTEGAAAEIDRRWDRQPVVLPHPHVVELDTLARLAATPRPEGPFRVGLHVKSLRASMDPRVLLPVLTAAVRDLGGVLQVNGHHDVLTPGGPRHDAELAALLAEAERRGEAEVHVHDYLDDAALWDYLRSLDVSVLPYRFGTHSGWLEACRDLGTAVVAPTCGFYADQGPVHSYVLDETRFEPASLVEALRDARDAGPVAPLTVADRREQRARVATAHRSLYGSLR